VQVSLTGNADFSTCVPFYSNILPEDWLTEEFVWHGFWDPNSIRDLHVTLTATGISILDDTPCIDVDVLEVELNPYCPGVYMPPQAKVPALAVNLFPSGDQMVSGWLPVPAYYRLQSPASQITSDFITVDPTIGTNGLILDIQDLPTLPPPPPGTNREWTSIQVQVQAMMTTETNTQVQLGLATNYGVSLFTDIITNEPLVYSVQWDYSPGLTDNQINRLYVEVIPNTITVGTGGNILYLYALEVTAGYTNVSTVLPPAPPSALPPPPPPGVYGPITLIDLEGEVFSCGSVGDCASPTGKLLGRLTVTNSTGLSCPVSFFINNKVNIQIFDTDTPTTSYPVADTIPAGTTLRKYSVYSWVGDVSDPYPAEPLNGNLDIIVTQGSNVYQASLPWTYLGI
jgi:hypothetical protein